MGMFVMGLAVGVAMGEANPQEKIVQFAVTGTLLLGTWTDGDMGAVIGPGVRVDFNLTKYLMISPETSLFWGTVSPGCTVNFRFGKGFIGLGGAITSGGFFEEGAIGLFKAHIGAKWRNWLIEGSLLREGRDAWINVVGLTAGFVF